MTTKEVYRHEGGYECDLAATPKGWVMSAVSMEDVDGKFVSNMDHDREWEFTKALLRPGVTYEDWAKAFVSLRPRLDLLESQTENVGTLHTTSAEQFSGVAVSGGEAPALLWTSYEGDQWSVSLFHKGEARVLAAGNHVLLSPSMVCDDDGKLWCAWVRREAAEDIIQITDAGQSRSFHIPGRYPSMAAVSNGAAVCFERFTDGESHIYFARISGDSVDVPIRVSSQSPLNFLPRCIIDTDGQLLVAWESSPAWGFDVNVDQIRHIVLKHINPVDGRLSDGPGTEDSKGVLPIPIRSYNRSKNAGQLINMTPSNPRLIRLGDDIVCTFRMYQPGLKAQGPWIVDGGLDPSIERQGGRESWYLCAIRWDGKSWSQPERVTEAVGFSHHPYGVATYNDDLLIACHCFNPKQMPPREDRVEVLQLGKGLPKMHEGVPTFEPQPMNPANPMSSAPALPDGPKGLRLVWGDLHDHTSHSSCYPALDGSPPDNVRLQRDLMENEIISIADHHRISDADYRHRLDLLERENTPGHVAIYGLEWAKPPWQHINFFTYDKDVMKELREILYGDLDIHLIFNEIAGKFPNKVTAIRHFHGASDTHTYLYDPRIEWAMEVVRGRGDMMATEEGMFGGLSEFPFPVNFIEWKGAKVGMIGASDHHMSKMGACLTGFWINELTGEAVFDALRNRRTIACGNGKMSLWVQSGSVGMGQVGQGQSPVNISVSVASPLPLERISLWSDGRWVQHQAVKERQLHLTFVDSQAGSGEHYYIVRAQTQQSAEYPKGPIIAYSSPIWMTVG